MALLSPWFLAGALAVGLPLWLHLLQRENPVKLRISSLMFFEKRTQSTIRERRFRHLLLLALRLALLLLLALAFAKPIWERPPAVVAGDIPSLHVIALDTSLSMQHSDRWTRAREAANGIIDSLDEGDRAQVIANGPSVSVVTDAIDDRVELRNAVASLAPTAARNSFGDVIEALRSLAPNADYPVEAHLISDYQNTAMPGRFNDLVLPATAALQIHNVAGDAAPNWAVESVKGSRQLFGVDRPKLEVTVGGYATPKVNKRVVLAIDGRQIAAATGEIPENGRATFTFEDFDPPRGFSRAEFVIEPADDLPADDRRLAALDNAEPDPLLFVSADNRKRDLLHYRTALGASTGVSFALESASPGEAERLNPERYALIVLSDIPQLSSGFLARLRSYVESGGSLFLALGPKTANAGKVVLTGHAVDQPLFAERGATRFQTAGRSDPSHPVVEQLKRLSGVKFFLYARVRADEADDVPLRLGNGDPLLLEHALGAGRVLLFASTIDNVWNDLPISPLFVPFAVETARYLTGMEASRGPGSGGLGARIEPPAKFRRHGASLRPARKPRAHAVGSGGPRRSHTRPGGFLRSAARRALGVAGRQSRSARVESPSARRRHAGALEIDRTGRLGGRPGGRRGIAAEASAAEDLEVHPVSFTGGGAGRINRRQPAFEHREGGLSRWLHSALSTLRPASMTISTASAGVSGRRWPPAGWARLR